jgi:LysR family transcriptional regulator, benzoate and cis,cis-muconate-responsive activator of ben and cat genes
VNIKQLTYFVAVAEELHFGRAAERLGMAQPPLSRQIAQLEQDVGALLFDRSRSQIRLTQAGVVMLEHARAIIGHMEIAKREVAQIGKGWAGRLRVAFVGSATHGVLPTVIKAYRAQYPDVELVLSAMNNADLKRALIQREIDIAIARPSLEDDEFRSELLNHEDLILAVPDNSPLDAKPTIALVDLKEEIFILYPNQPRPSFADHILSVCRKEGFEPAERVFAQDYQTAISLVSVGVGIAMVPQSVSQTQRIGVHYRTYRGFNPGTSLSLNVRRDNRSPHVTRFFESAREQTKAKPAAARSAQRPG